MNPITNLVQTYNPELSPGFDPLQHTVNMADGAAGGNIVLAGAGPVGIRFCTELLKRKPLSKIKVFGNEPYNRVQLSSLLAGALAIGEWGEYS
ncbi:MAG: hypothetical protein ACI9Y1_003473 [Lentisphaeria bacterium]|jgi:hypothetical protein